eukprot:763849-Hanusia_phi.AAC.1
MLFALREQERRVIAERRLESFLIAYGSVAVPPLPPAKDKETVAAQAERLDSSLRPQRSSAQKSARGPHKHNGDSGQKVASKNTASSSKTLVEVVHENVGRG